MQEVQDFITAGLLSDEAWSHALNLGFDLPKVELSPAERLRKAINEGMAEESAEIAAIIANTASPTFANTIEALERSGRKLERATTLMYNLLSAETSDELNNLANEIAPVLSDHGNDIMLNPALFARVKAVYDESPSLEAEERMLLDKTYESFERAGATLSEEDKRKFREITGTLSSETLKFSQNLLKDTNAFILHLTDEAELDGLPAIHREAARSEAAARNLEGWVVTLQSPSFGPFMMYASRRDLRKRVYLAYHTRCKHGDDSDNSEVVRRIVNLRLQLARLLGYEDYAHYALKRRMADRPERVNSLLEDLIDRYAEKASEEVKEVENYARLKSGDDDFVFQPWDFAYYSRMLKDERYSYDPDLLRPYLELSRVKAGIFGLANRLYGISFKEANDVPVYHKDVTAYRVYDRDGGYLALLYLDFFPRTGKQGGAWMTSYREEYAYIGNEEQVTTHNSFRPVVSVTTNFTKPGESTPALLTLGEVETFLHEFGHALHGIFAMTRYAALSGTSVFWDFVELPSQIMENYASEADFLNTFAGHYMTEEAIPAEYLERLRRSRRYQAAYACMRQVSFGLLDMAFYSRTEPLEEDLKAFEERAWQRARLLPEIPETCMCVQFGHIMSGGYAAGYYSYKWAEVLDADAFALFREKGIFNEATAASFRENILSRGGTIHPEILYQAFRGSQPTLDALLRRDGIIEELSSC